MTNKYYWIALFSLFSIGVFADDTKTLKQFIVHIETGEKWDDALPPMGQEQFDEHSANMNQLRKQGTILFGARYSEFGLLVIQTESLQSAIEILEADPGVAAGIFKFRIEPISIFYPWQDPREN